jgi:cystathionine beta-lyase/cystathionine gamma-synthase
LAHVRSVTPVAQQSMVRYQIGLEGVEDLIADLDIGLRFLKQDNF